MGWYAWLVKPTPLQSMWSMTLSTMVVECDWYFYLDGCQWHRLFHIGCVFPSLFPSLFLCIVWIFSLGCPWVVTCTAWIARGRNGKPWVEIAFVVVCGSPGKKWAHVCLPDFRYLFWFDIEGVLLVCISVVFKTCWHRKQHRFQFRAVVLMWRCVVIKIGYSWFWKSISLMGFAWGVFVHKGMKIKWCSIHSGISKWLGHTGHNQARKRNFLMLEFPSVDWLTRSRVMLNIHVLVLCYSEAESVGFPSLHLSCSSDDVLSRNFLQSSTATIMADLPELVNTVSLQNYSAMALTRFG